MASTELMATIEMLVDVPLTPDEAETYLGRVLPTAISEERFAGTVIGTKVVDEQVFLVIEASIPIRLIP